MNNKTILDSLLVLGYFSKEGEEQVSDLLFLEEHEAMTEDFMLGCGYSEADAAEAASCVMEFEGIVTY